MAQPQHRGPHRRDRLAPRRPHAPANNSIVGTPRPTPARRGRGRPASGTDTRPAILDAARGCFAERLRPGHDPRHRRRGGRRPGPPPPPLRHQTRAVPGRHAPARRPHQVVRGILAGDPNRLGERIVDTFLTVWDSPAGAAWPAHGPQRRQPRTVQLHAQRIHGLQRPHPRRQRGSASTTTPNCASRTSPPNSSGSPSPGTSSPRTARLRQTPARRHRHRPHHPALPDRRGSDADTAASLRHDRAATARVAPVIHSAADVVGPFVAATTRKPSAGAVTPPVCAARQVGQDRASAERQVLRRRSSSKVRKLMWAKSAGKSPPCVLPTAAETSDSPPPPGTPRRNRRPPRRRRHPRAHPVAQLAVARILHTEICRENDQSAGALRLDQVRPRAVRTCQPG